MKKLEEKIINQFKNASIKMNSYIPKEKTIKIFGQWIIDNPNGTYKDYKIFLNNIKEAQ
jgi:hypothetical protein|tara:strand:+ start:26 stop:202 length:177 start_codon:yes stop_codon:yes gene_type:complete